MEELLKKLLEAEILSEETKEELQSALDVQLSEAIEAAKAEAEDAVRAELTEQWVEERDALIEAVDTKVNEFLTAEMDELKEDIERFRDLEAEYAEKIVEAKAEMATELEENLAELVDKIDTFLEMRIAAEMEELKEDIDQAKKFQFGAEVFEGFVREYKKNFVNEDETQAELAETQKQLDDALAALTAAEKANDAMIREAKMTELLQPLRGKQKEVMEAILNSVETEYLEEGYTTFIGRVMKESEEESVKEKEDKVLAENSSSENPENKDLNNAVSEGEIITGDTEETITESVNSEEEKGNKAYLDQLLKLGGVK